MIIANGCPKSGTHALLALLKSLGHERMPGTIKPNNYLDYIEFRATHKYDIIHGHMPFGVEAQEMLNAGHKFITVVRQPRNVIVSYKRWVSISKPLVDCMHRFFTDPFAKRLEPFLHWHGRCTVIKFEDIVAPAYDEDFTRTYTGALSDWRRYWSDEAEREWNAIGGPWLEIRSGYTPEKWMGK